MKACRRSPKDLSESGLRTSDHTVCDQTFSTVASALFVAGDDQDTSRSTKFYFRKLGVACKSGATGQMCHSRRTVYD